MAKKEKEKKAKKPDYEVQFASQAIAKKVRNKERRNKISIILIAMLLLIAGVSGIVWGALQFIEYNSVQIAVGDAARGSISLYNVEDFSENKPGSPTLLKQGPQSVGDCTYREIAVALESIRAGSGTEGSDKAEYIGFTFRARNMSGEDMQYISEIIIPSESKNLADAVRVMVIIYDAAGNEVTKNIYARPEAKEDGTMEPVKVVPYAFEAIEKPTDANIAKVENSLTTPFLEDNVNGETIVMRNETADALTLEKDAWHTYVVAIWLEGEDKDCADALDGGKMSVRINLDLVSEEEE